MAGWTILGGTIVTGGANNKQRIGFSDQYLLYSDDDHNGTEYRPYPVMINAKLEESMNEPGTFTATLLYSVDGDKTKRSGFYNTIDMRRSWIAVLYNNIPEWFGYVSGFTIEDDSLDKQFTATGLMGVLQFDSINFVNSDYTLTDADESDSDKKKQESGWDPDKDRIYYTFKNTQGDMDAKSDYDDGKQHSMWPRLNGVLKDRIENRSVNDLTGFHKFFDLLTGVGGTVTAAGGYYTDLGDDGSYNDIAYNALTNILDTYGGYYRIRYEKAPTGDGSANWYDVIPYFYYVDYLKEITDENEQVLEYGKNITDLSMSYEYPSDFCNYLEYIGIKTETKSKGWWIWKKYYTVTTRTEKKISDPESIKKYGRCRRVMYSSLDNTNPEDTVEKDANSKWDEYTHDIRPDISLSFIEESGKHFYFLRKTRIISELHGLGTDENEPLWMICTKRTIDFEKPREIEAEFSFSEKRKLSSSQKQKWTTANVQVAADKNAAIIGALNTMSS